MYFLLNISFSPEVCTLFQSDNYYNSLNSFVNNNNTEKNIDMIIIFLNHTVSSLMLLDHIFSH